MSITKQDVLEYHTQGRPGKIEVTATKPLTSQQHLSLAYSPGVAIVVEEIDADPSTAYLYTAKSNLVAVVSNGTAILGLGNRGALASKPVMEGKGVLFKTFADIDVFDIEVDTEDPDELINVVKNIAPTFGGINLEDIKAPECFYIEEKLKAMLPIPVFHDDQHGTAIISAAGLINSLKITGKKFEDLKVAVSGAGASAMACAKLYMRLGVRPENVIMVDSTGVIYKGRTNKMNEYKEAFAVETDARTLADAMVGADVFLGLSVKDLVSAEMVKTMAPNPVIFAMANPDPEIPYPVAREARPDAIIGTGRSDYPNQVNNVLGFPFIFRGALDVAATAINEEMKLAAAHALADLAFEDVPDSVLNAYQLDKLSFGREYIIPKPLDPRVLLWEAPAVAQAAMETGVAQIEIDIEQYRDSLARRQGVIQEVRRHFINATHAINKRIVFGEGEETKIIRAAYQVMAEDIGTPILLGSEKRIREQIEKLGLDFAPEIVNPSQFERYNKYAESFYELRKRKGHTEASAMQTLLNRHYFGAMMVKMGDADCYLAGLTTSYPSIIRPALEIFHTKPSVKRASGVYLMIANDKKYLFTDATVNIDPNAEDLAEIAILANDYAKTIEIDPVVAMLSFSNFGSTPHPETNKVREAVELIRQRRPDIKVDGEVQADFAVSGDLMEDVYPFSQIRSANILVFPDLSSANIAYKLVGQIGNAQTIGPILLGLGAPVHVLQQGDSVNNIVTMATIASLDAKDRETEGLRTI